MNKTIILASLTSLLTACGGGSGGSNTHTPPPVIEQPKKIGVLTDGIIQGASYTTSSGLSGVTNASGEFTYREGDQITFTLGPVQLGNTITALARITPIELTSSRQTRLNMMVLLQSLDQDQNHDNGISIGSTDVALLTGKNINLNDSSTTFKNALSNAFTNTNKTVVTEEKAIQNFTEAFYKDIAGTWEIGRNSTEVVVVHIDQYGHYFLGEVAASTYDAKSGIEFG